jgi:hypothetical protein
VYSTDDGVTGVVAQTLLGEGWMHAPVAVLLWTDLGRYVGCNLEFCE